MDAIRRLREGQVILLGTDTLPGLHGMATLDAVADEMIRLKGSPQGRPFLLLFASLQEVLRYGRPAHGGDESLLAQAWPGPLTALLRPTERALPRWIHEGRSVAVRVPHPPPLRELLEELGAPLYSTSANAAGEIPATTMQEAQQRFSELAAFDLGVSSEGQASTVVDLLDGPGRILREGSAPWPPWSSSPS